MLNNTNIDLYIVYEIVFYNIRLFFTGVCQDKLSNCAQYTQSACGNQYQAWAIANCPKYCGLCGESKSMYIMLLTLYIYSFSDVVFQSLNLKPSTKPRYSYMTSSCFIRPNKKRS